MFLCSQPDGSGPVPAVVELEAGRAPVAPPLAAVVAAVPDAEAAATAAPLEVAVPVVLGPGEEILEGDAASPSTPNISSARALLECLALSAAVLFA